MKNNAKKPSHIFHEEYVLHDEEYVSYDDFLGSVQALPPVEKLQKKFEQRWDEIDVHLKTLKRMAPNVGNQQDTQEMTVAKEKYAALEAHISTLKQQVDDFCSGPTSEKSEKLEKTYDKMCRDPKMQARRNPRLDAIVDSVIELTGGLVRFAVGLFSWGLSETSSNVGKNIVAFFTPKSKSEKKVEPLGEVKQAIQITKKSS